MEHKAFIIYIAALSVNLGNEVHLLRRAQIAHLKTDKVFSEVSSKYTNFANVFSLKLATEFPEYTKINNHAIELMDY